MPRYLSLVKYSDDALRGVRSDGYQSRPEALRALAASFGGSLISMDYTPDDRWDFAAMFELPTGEALFGMTSFAQASGTVADSMTIELFTPEQADAAMHANQPDYVPPGEAG
jgi:uncharacterized protein with GYD domain